jgi:hypothetical protein
MLSYAQFLLRRKFFFPITEFGLNKAPGKNGMTCLFDKSY